MSLSTILASKPGNLHRFFGVCSSISARVFSRNSLVLGFSLEKRWEIQRAADRARKISWPPGDTKMDNCPLYSCY